jgi:hypothetical protein
MAEEEEKKEEEGQQGAAVDDFLPYHFDDPGTYNYYATDAVAIVADSEVAIYFGNGKAVPFSDGSQKVKLDLAVILSHQRFISLMNYLAVRYDFLQKLYDGQPMGIRDMRRDNPERVKQLEMEFFSPRKKNDPPPSQSGEQGI